ncbi:hypothetical protein HUN08_00150 [Gordonia sp. X0973]|nr:hypothetical protein HUN08_00150 [Gordonia sp. X0973]
MAIATAATAGALAITTPATASAARIPFQIQPASYGNPNGSFDVPPIRCAVEPDHRRGTVMVTGTDRGRWGCLPYARVWWMNRSTGRSGVAKLSSGLNGVPAQAVLRTGRGELFIRLDAWGSSTVTPGFTTLRV